MTLTEESLKHICADVDMLITASVAAFNEGSTEHWRSPKENTS